MTRFHYLTKQTLAAEPTVRTGVASRRWSWEYLACLGAVIVLGLTYLILVNTVATKGYHVRQLSQHIETLKSDERKLQLEIAARQATSAATTTATQLELVSVDTVDYVSASGGAVAIK